MKHVPTTCYTKIIVTSLILILSTTRGGRERQRGVAAHKQPVSVAKYVDSTHNMKQRQQQEWEQEQKEAPSLATACVGESTTKKLPVQEQGRQVDSVGSQKVKQEVRRATTTTSSSSTGWGFPNECSMNEFQPQNTNSMENSFFHTIGN